MNKIQMINCPNCGESIVATSRVCLHCKCNVASYNQQQPQTQDTTTQNNPNMMRCPACGNAMSKLADKCPSCGNPRPKKVANPGVLDAIAIFSIVIAIVCYVTNTYLVSYGIMLLLLIIYWAYYMGIKNDPEIDSSKVKQSLNIITILFIVMFCISIVFVF